MNEGDRRLSGALEGDDTDNPYKFKWFMSLTRRKKGKQCNKENQSDFEGLPEVLGDAPTRPEAPYHSTNIFYTLRKRFKRRFSRSRKSYSLPTFEPGPLEPALPRPAPEAAADTSVIAGSDTVSSPPEPEGAESLAERTSNIYVNMNEVRDKVMSNERLVLAKYGWYWGPLSRNAAQKRLTSQLNGSFLLRDSQTDKYQFTLSFRSAGCTLHSRIDYRNGYWHIESDRYKSIVDLIEDTMRKSKNGVFCYVKTSSEMLPPFPVRLTIPVNRFYEVTSLQHLCRFIIRQKINLNNVEQLPLPSKLKDYIRENFYENL
ncbi:suppressor of cytokine signaling 6 [Phlebotomus argentipes]|uniref:suppressor of cytokine signaling 6 n=1 Tax=Phlebotomus argentipes TaxID=94469 RepID=UPI0028930297|nr:suppressor of cytokine signaling 6 [Phlebotomus argentipes]